MTKPQSTQSIQSTLPSVHHVLELPIVADLIAEFGRPLLTHAIRIALNQIRDLLATAGELAWAQTKEDNLILRIKGQLAELTDISLRPVINLTGIVLHTNLGRAPMPEEAVQAVAVMARSASNLEFDLSSGSRGDRDSHLENQICRLTGAEAATVVNNNAAAVLLTLNTLALHKEVLVSRGELVEIGGSFRIPDIMARANSKLREVGTTNRTHLYDFEEGLSPRTAMILKAHTSNFKIIGYTGEVDVSKLVGLAKKAQIPFVIDLGSGSLISVSELGLPHEPTVKETLSKGADLVTFSGDKLLGGPQCGIIAGRKDLIERVNKNPMKRALRIDKMTIAALSAVLRIYENPAKAVQTIPALRMLARPETEIWAMAKRLLPLVASKLEANAIIEIVACKSQVGSGALPVETLPSAGFKISPKSKKWGEGSSLKFLAAAFRNLPLPVIGRIHNNTLIFDLRCLENETSFIQQLQLITVKRPAS